MINIKFSVRHMQRNLRRAKGPLALQNTPFFEILYACHSPLRIRNHLCKQVCETRATQIAIAAAIEVSVVDRLAVGRQPQSRNTLWQYLALPRSLLFAAFAWEDTCGSFGW